MNLERASLWILIVSLLGANLVVAHHLRKTKSVNAELYNRTIEQTVEQDIHSNKNENRLILSLGQLVLEGEKLNDIPLYTKDDEKTNLSNVLTESYKLIYFFSHDGCNACYEPFLIKLEEMSQKIGKENMLLLTNMNRRTLKLLWGEKDDELYPYRMIEEFNSPAFDISYAYAFLLNKDMTIKKLVITDKINTTLSNSYLNYLVQYFNEKKNTFIK